MNKSISKRPKYSSDTLNIAVAAVKSGLSFSNASDQFNIPKATIHRHFKDSTLSTRPGPSYLLSSSEENELIVYIEKFLKRGMPTRKGDILDSATILLKRRNQIAVARPGKIN